jgi:hypothetical protein
VAGYTRGFVLENPQDRDKTKEKNDVRLNPFMPKLLGLSLTEP